MWSSAVVKMRLKRFLKRTLKLCGKAVPVLGGALLSVGGGYFATTHQWQIYKNEQLVASKQQENTDLMAVCYAGSEAAARIAGIASEIQFNSANLKHAETVGLPRERLQKRQYELIDRFIDARIDFSSFVRGKAMIFPVKLKADGTNNFASPFNGFASYYSYVMGVNINTLDARDMNSRVQLMANSCEQLSDHLQDELKIYQDSLEIKFIE